MNRFCASGLQAIASGAEHIMCGFANVVIAGGTESMSLVPMGGNKVCPNPTLVDEYPDVYLSTGLVAENHARDYSITREEQDAFALTSHQRAVAAIEAGRFSGEITPLNFSVAVPQNGGHEIRAVTFDRDEGPRRDTSAQALAKLRPAFHANGTVTAGNSSQTSDGARRSSSPRTRSRANTSSSRWRASSRSPQRASRQSGSASGPCRRSRKCSSVPALRSIRSISSS
jgi:acetyl-CoA acyltransferase